MLRPLYLNLKNYFIADHNFIDDFLGNLLN